MMLNFLTAALIVGVPGVTDVPVIAQAMDSHLGDWVAGDGGVPVELNDGSTLYLFGDTFTGPNDGNTFPAGWGMVHSSAIHIDGDTVTPMLNLLPSTVAGSYYWIADGHHNQDGSMWVVAHEVISVDDWLFGFEVVDTDLFRVRDPLNVMSWRLAEKFEEGWWDGKAAHFVDGTNLVVWQRRGTETTVGYNTTTQETFDLNEPAGVDSLFVPVEYGGQWWAASYDFWNEVTTVWQAPTIAGPWVEVDSIHHDLPEGVLVYGSQLHVTDGRLVLHWSNNRFEMSAGDPLAWVRPTYQVFETV